MDKVKSFIDRLLEQLREPEAEASDTKVIRMSDYRRKRIRIVKSEGEEE